MGNPLDEFLETTIENSSGLSHVKSLEENNNVTLEGNSYYLKDFRTESIMNDKQYSKFIKSCEGLVRRSEEYKSYIGFLKNSLNIHNCAILGNISDEDASIEFHHYPFTLYDICQTLIEKYIDEKRNLTTFSIADECIKLHYENKIGLVPLSITVHELVHSGEIFIDLRQVYGKVTEFIEEYKLFIDQDKIEKVLNIYEKSKNNEPIKNNENLLSYNSNKKFINTLEDVDTNLLLENIPMENREQRNEER